MPRQGSLQERYPATKIPTGRDFRALRHELKMSYEDVSNALGVGISTIRSWEKQEELQPLVVYALLGIKGQRLGLVPRYASGVESPDTSNGSKTFHPPTQTRK